MKKSIAALLTLLMVLGIFAGCASKEAPAATAAPEATAAAEIVAEATVPSETAAAPASVTVTDDAGRELTVNQPVERVILLDTSPFEIMDAFGKMDLIVGNHQAIAKNPLYAELKDLPEVATHSEINFEAIAELQPQVVLPSVRAHGVVTDEEALDGFDIQDVKLNLRNPDTMRNGITVMGQLFDSQEKADELIAFYDKWEQFIADKVKDIPEEDRVKVFVEYHAGAFKTGAPNSRFYSQVELAGGINIAKDLTVGDEPEVSAEWVAEMNPDVIIREASGLGYKAEDTAAAKEIYDELMNREGLAMTKAVQDGNVHVVSVDIYSRPGSIVGVSYLAKWFYPEIFAEFDPSTVLQEYYELFHPGKELKGIWTYDE